MTKPIFFVKSETSFGNYAYTVAGVNLSSPKFGGLEIAAGCKANNSGNGPYTDCRLTTPKFKIAESSNAFEFRSKAFYSKKHDKDAEMLLNQSIYLKSQYPVSDSGSIYSNIGVDTAIRNNTASSVSPFAIIGYGHDITTQECTLSPYIELSGNKAYEIQKEKWGDFSAGVSIGIKVKF